MKVAENSFKIQLPWLDSEMTTLSGHWVKNKLQNRRVFALALVKDGLENHNRGGKKATIKLQEIHYWFFPLGEMGRLLSSSAVDPLKFTVRSVASAQTPVPIEAFAG